MKVLWIVNKPLNILYKKLYGKEEDGLWMTALLKEFREKRRWQVVIATTAAVSQTLREEEDGIVYYALPHQVPLLYEESASGNIAAWKDLLEREKPNLVQVWGTEFTHGLCALRLARNIPSVIYMQGYLVSIARHYLAGMTHKEIRRTRTFRDIIKRDDIEQQQQKYRTSAAKEKEMFQLAGRVICENDWCEAGIKEAAPDTVVYRCPLSVNPVFTKQTWDIEKAEKHSIICNASGYPVKGLHMILRAIALLKDDYPDIRLYVPGQKMISDGSVKWTVRKRGYTRYIEKLVKELGVEDHIVWLGPLSQEKLAEQYTRARVFVLGSSIENHSSSLKEAMMVGTPSVASAVGGIPEYVRQGENGFLYRFGEYDIMASYIRRLFEDDKIALHISEAGRAYMKNMHEGVHIYTKMVEIYEQILKERK